MDLTFYKTNTKNQLFSLPSSAGAAYKYYFVNAGNIQNMGVELTLGAVPILTNQFKWNTTLNFSRNKNEVKKLHDDLASFIQGDEGFSSSYTMRLVEGGSFGDIYGKAFERDKYGAIVYGRDGLPQEIGSGNTAKVGNCNPAFLLGWGNSFTYKDFSFYFLIDGHFGGDVLAQTQAVLDQTGVSKVSGETRTMGYVDLEGHHIYNIKGFYEQVGGRNGVTEYICTMLPISVCGSYLWDIRYRRDCWEGNNLLKRRNCLLSPGICSLFIKRLHLIRMPSFRRAIAIKGSIYSGYRLREVSALM